MCGEYTWTVCCETGSLDAIKLDAMLSAESSACGARRFVATS